MRQVLFAGALGVAALLAPSTGFADETGAPETEAARAASSARCFNEGLYRKGATADYDMQVSGDGATPPRRIVTLVGAKKDFNGVSAVSVKARFFDDRGKPAGQTESYLNVRGAALLNYGLTSDTVVSTLEPAGRTPYDLREGEAFDQSLTVANTYPDGRTETTRSVRSFSFAGFATLNTAVGRFRVCKFQSRSRDRFVSPAGPTTIITNKMDYVAAEGPYRGFSLRAKVSAKYSAGPVINQVINVTTIREFSAK